LILVVCILLNQTQRKQVEKVLPEFIKNWPTPQEFINADLTDVGNLIGSLGFTNRRSLNLMKMTKRYLTGPWSDPRELPGIGEYGARAWEIFCLGKLGNEPPKDHALVKYWEFAMIMEQPCQENS
jgi:methyl-CpG-binding domain protein 4